MKSIDTILFDWDGTLLDSASIAFRAFRKALADLGITLETELYERIYSPNWYGMYQTLELPEHRWQEADELWTKHYGTTIVPLVEGGRDVLSELTRRGYSLGIVTSGSRVRVLRELAGLELLEMFRAVVCTEDVIQKKPHPEGLTVAMQRLEKKPEFCCYVGDSPMDVEMGKSAGMQTIGIVGDYPSGKMLRSSNPDFCFDSVRQLLAHFCGVEPPTMRRG